MQPKRVLFIGHNAALAGAEISLVNFASHLDRGRFAPSVLLPRPGAICALLEANHVPTYIAPPPSFGVTSETAWDSPAHLRAIRPLRDAIIGLAPDVIVVNTNTIPQATIAALATTIPLVVHLHAFVTRRQSEWQSERERMADRMWLQFADVIAACSPWVARFYEELLEREVSVVANTTTTAGTDNAPPQPPRFVMLATLEQHKRADVFIRAAARVQQAQPDAAFSCRLYGDGAREQREQLQGLVTQHQLGEKFTLHPASRDISAIYTEATCAVIPSDIEPFSMVAIEAAAHGRPVIATRSGGPDDLVVDGETGFLVGIGDDEAMADAMLKIIRSPALTAQMGEAARERFATHYAPAAVMPVYETLLNRALSAPSGERRHIARTAARYFMSRHEA